MMKYFFEGMLRIISPVLWWRTAEVNQILNRSDSDAIRSDWESILGDWRKWK
jgi:hypothetical protein